jgi:hypothetical protein
MHSSSHKMFDPINLTGCSCRVRPNYVLLVLYKSNNFQVLFGVVISNSKTCYAPCLILRWDDDVHIFNLHFYTTTILNSKSASSYANRKWIIINIRSVSF